MKRTAEIILASASPRRLQLLRQIGLDPVVRVSKINEEPIANEAPSVYAERLAHDKGRFVKEGVTGDALVVGADTVVVHEGRLLGKPRDRREAREFLERLSACEHQVVTALSLLWGGRALTEHEVTRVWFSRLSQPMIEAYLDTEEYLDKAGGYGIQSYAALFIPRIEGCYFNVMGFPIALFYRMSKQMGWSFFD